MCLSLTGISPSNTRQPTLRDARVCARSIFPRVIACLIAIAEPAICSRIISGSMLAAGLATAPGTAAAHDLVFRVLVENARDIARLLRLRNLGLAGHVTCLHCVAFRELRP